MSSLPSSSELVDLSPQEVSTAAATSSHEAPSVDEVSWGNVETNTSQSRKREEEEEEEEGMTNPIARKKVKSTEEEIPKTNAGAENLEDTGATKVLSRREANRIHAFKSRQRSKHLLQELQQLVTQYNYEKLELERQNAVLSAQVEVLQQQNMTLLQSHPSANLYGGGVPPNNLHWMQALLQAMSASSSTAPSTMATTPSPHAPPSWMMNLLLQAAATPRTTAPPPATDEWLLPSGGPPPAAPVEPQQQLQRAFQQAILQPRGDPEETPPATTREEPTVHPV